MFGLVVREVERDARDRPRLTTDARRRLKQVKRENLELKRANEALPQGVRVRAHAELGRRPK